MSEGIPYTWSSAAFICSTFVLHYQSTQQKKLNYALQIKLTPITETYVPY